MPSTLISGANRGLGLEFAKQYLADGWQVYAGCALSPWNVADSVSVTTAAAEMQGSPIDILINNAGVGGPRGQQIGNIDYETWARVLDVNTLGPMRVAEAFLDNVEQSERKLMVTITSSMGSIADNTSGGRIRLSEFEGCREYGYA